MSPNSLEVLKTKERLIKCKWTKLTVLIQREIPRPSNQMRIYLIEIMSKNKEINKALSARTISLKMSTYAC